MKKITLILLMIFIFPVFLSAENKYKANLKTSKLRTAPNKVLVRFSDHENIKLSSLFYINDIAQFEIDRPILNKEETFLFNPSIKQKHASTQNYDLQKLYQSEEKLSRTYLLSFKSDLQIEELCYQLNQFAEIEIAEPYYLYPVNYIPNDPEAANSQQLIRCKFFDFWEHFKGDTSVVIGISDTGCDQNHKDMKGNIAPNWAEIPNNGIDEDDNKCVDDFLGYNFSWEEEGTQPDNTYHISNHGMEVASIAAATFDNDRGMAGAAGKCRFFPIKIMKASDTRYNTYTYESVLYAANRGFKVLNCSWGIVKPASEIEQSIIDYAVSRDVAIVASGGNLQAGYIRTDHNFPAAYKGVLGVGEVNEIDRLSSASFVGVSTDIMAPGVGNIVCRNGNQYGTCAGGTSYAAPVVAGGLALIRARYPELSAQQAITYIRQCVDDISDKNTAWKHLMSGRLNMKKAIDIPPTTIPGFEILDYSYYDQDGNKLERLNGKQHTKMKIQLKNYLSDAKNLKFTITAVHGIENYIIMYDSLQEFSSVAAGAEIELNEFAFDNLASGYLESYLRLDIYGENGYHDFRLIPFIPNYDLTSFENDAIKVYMSDRGRIGFTGDIDYKHGAGFFLKGESNELEEAGLIVADVDRGRLLNYQYGKGKDANDYSVQKSFTGENNNINIMVDSELPEENQIGLEIKQEVIVPTGNWKVFKMKMELTNTNPEAISKISLGYYMDWDANIDFYEQNKIEFLNDVGLSLDGALAGEMLFYDKDNYFYGSAVRSMEDGAVAQAAGLSITDYYNYLNQGTLSELLTSGTSIQNILPSDKSYFTGMYFPNEIASGESVEFSICNCIASSREELVQNLSKCLEDSFSSIDEEVFSNNISIFPNPSSDLINLNLNRIYKTIKIYDQLGNLLMINDKVSSKFVTLDISNLANGVYFIEVSNESEIRRSTFIKH